MTMSMNDKIAELTALETKATKGPWEKEEESNIDSSITSFNSMQGNFWVAKYVWSKDAALIVSMRNALPELLQYAKVGYNCESLQDDLDAFQGFFNDLYAGLRRRFPEIYSMLEGAEYGDQEFSAQELFEHVIDVVHRDKDEQIQAAIARAEKAEEELEQAREWGRKKHEQLEELKYDRQKDLAYVVAELKQVKAERATLAKECAEFQKAVDCDVRNDAHDYRCWLEWAKKEARPRSASGGEGVKYESYSN